MNQPRILIVDDEPNIRFVLTHTLRHENYILDTAANGVEAIERINANSYDLILLDLKMEPVGGIEVLNVLRKQNSDAVVIILTAHGTLESAVEALRLESYDYLFKPATPDAIRKRVREGLEHRRKILRRQQLLSQIGVLRQTLDELESEHESLSQPVNAERFLHSGRLVIDRHHRVVTLDERLLDLTTAEFNMLTCLVEAAPNVVPASQLVKAALEYEVEDAEAREMVKVYIYHLRQKIEANPSDSHRIKTVRNQGYFWCG